MIPSSDWNSWRWQFRNRITDVATLVSYLPQLKDNKLQLEEVAVRYPMAVTPYYLSLIDPDNTDDPLLKQFLPDFKEISLQKYGQPDPLAEERNSAVPHLVHRYPDRVLMVLTNLCPLYCRHCTRKRKWSGGIRLCTASEIDAMLEYIGHHAGVRDVILSGGDPLVLSTPRLEGIIRRLRQIPHVEIIRIGSRFPVVLPQRIDDDLCRMLSRYGPIWLNTQFNHPREITPQAALACDRLLHNGVPLNNQAVLLKGVNDSLEIQMELAHRLLAIKVRPYYLFQCDCARGTEHFRTPLNTGIEIIAGMQGYTSGLAVPVFAVDLPGGGGKVSLQPDCLLSSSDDNEVLFRNYQGRIIKYPNPVTNK
jgi:lysine 2,3-aminomutase